MGLDFDKGHSYYILIPIITAARTKLIGILDAKDDSHSERLIFLLF